MVATPIPKRFRCKLFSSPVRLATCPKRLNFTLGDFYEFSDELRRTAVYYIGTLEQSNAICRLVGRDFEPRQDDRGTVNERARPVEKSARPLFQPNS